MIFSLTLHHSACVRLGRGLEYGGGQLCIATVQRTKPVHRWQRYGKRRQCFYVVGSVTLWGRPWAGLGAHTLKRQCRSMSASAQGDGNDWEHVKIFIRNHVLKDRDHLPLKQGEVGV